MKYVIPTTMPKPSGHYSPGIAAEGFVFISGQLPIRPDGTKNPGLPIEDQTSIALENLKRVLDAAGSGIEKVVKTTIFIEDISLWDRVNSVYSVFFGAHRPARSIVPVAPLHFGFKIEIEAIASL